MDPCPDGAAQARDVWERLQGPIVALAARLDAEDIASGARWYLPAPERGAVQRQSRRAWTGVARVPHDSGDAPRAVRESGRPARRRRAWEVRQQQAFNTLLRTLLMPDLVGDPYCPVPR